MVYSLPTSHCRGTLKAASPRDKTYASLLNNARKIQGLSLKLNFDSEKDVD